MDFCIDLHCLALNLKAKSKIRLQMDLHKLTVLLGIEAKGSPDPVRIITNWDLNMFTHLQVTCIDMHCNDTESFE